MLRKVKIPHVPKRRQPPLVQLVELKTLREHEEVDEVYLEELKVNIKRDGMLKFAIAVDKNTNIILDGVHRFNALKQLGCFKIPVVFVDYNSPDIEVNSWRKDWKVTKQIVIEAGLHGKKIPPHTSKHMIRSQAGLRHISVIERCVNFPLKELRGD